MSNIDGYAYSEDHDFDPNDWRAMQHADECLIQREIVEALEHAKERPLNDDELQLLAWAAGVRETFNQGVTR